MFSIVSVVCDLGPNIDARVFASGAGIGYIPMAISTKDNPNDHISLCNVYCVPCSRSGLKIKLNKINYKNLK